MQAHSSGSQKFHHQAQAGDNPAYQWHFLLVINHKFLVGYPCVALQANNPQCQTIQKIICSRLSSAQQILCNLISSYIHPWVGAGSPPSGSSAKFSADGEGHDGGCKASATQPGRPPIHGKVHPEVIRNASNNRSLNRTLWWPPATIIN